MDFGNVKSLMIGGRAVSKLLVGGRLAWQKAKPEPEPVVEGSYIETDGVASCMNLDFKPSANCSLEVCAKVFPDGGLYNVVMSAGSGRSARFTFRYNLSSKSIDVTPSTTVLADYPEPAKGVYRYSNGKAAYDDHEVDYVFDESSWPMFLGAMGGNNYFSRTRFYYAKFWESGELIRDLVPYSGPRGVGLLDLVHDVLYTNAGGGGLVYGDESAQVTPYIESDGVASYLDFGFTPTANCDIEFAMKYDGTAGDVSFCGANTNRTVNRFGVIVDGSDVVVRLNGAQPISSKLDTTGYNRVSVRGNLVEVNGDSGTVTSKNTGATSLQLFADPYWGPVGVMRCSYFKAWEDGVLIRDCVPYSGPRGVGMLDRVNDTLYTNAGGGSLTYGEE